MHTMSGKAVDLRNVVPEDIDIQDIALGLARTCRFNGQVDRMFTVLEHSIIGARLAYTPRLKLEALLHDTGEAYTGDIILPMKECFPEMALFEDKITAVIFDKLYPRSYCTEGGVYKKSLAMAVLDQNMAAWESYTFRPHLPFTHHTWSTIKTWKGVYEWLQGVAYTEDLVSLYIDMYRDLSSEVAYASACRL